MVAVLKDEGGNKKYTCGGSLIHPRVVLTAAHCVRTQSLTPGKWSIRAGEWDTRKADEEYPHQEIDVKTIVKHPKFHSKSFFNDMALLVLTSPVKLEDSQGVLRHIDFTCLPPNNFVSYNTDGCFVTGWGKDKFGDEGQVQVLLKKVQLPILEQKECENRLKKTRLTQKFYLHPSFICAGGQEGVDVCTGDGGSPLVCPIPGMLGRYHQVGIVSWGIGCGEGGIPGVYTSVAHLKEWIDGEMKRLGFETNEYTP